jgi:lysozyme family protein
MEFEQAIVKVLAHEGGFVDHPDDPGGATKFGITEAVARRVGYRGNMRDLPLDLAKQIYRREYWDAMRADELPAEARYVLFDGAVNSGVAQAARWLQRAVGVPADGVIGPKTIAAAAAIDGARLKAAVLAQRLRFMAGLAAWPSFSRGWAMRIADLMEA